MQPDDPFLPAILAEPADDLPRLIHADWLTDRGDPRGEFIRLQIARENDAATRDNRAVADRVRALELEHGRDWAGPVGRYAYRWEFRRGYVEGITIRAEELLKAGQQLFRSAPIRKLALLGAARNLNKLLAKPWFAKLTALHLTGAQIGNAGLEALSRAQPMPELEVLRLASNSIDDRGIEHLVACRQLGNLRSLILRDNFVADRGAYLLGESKTFPHLYELDLANNDVSPDVCRWLRDEHPQIWFDLAGQHKVVLLQDW